MARASLVFALIALLLAPLTAFAQSTPAYEVWAIDQADASKGGSTLYVYQGAAPTAAPEMVDLEAAARGVGAGPGVRPHLLLFNQGHSHGVLAYVASGHVQVIRASDRKVVASIDVGEQAHGAIPAPDNSFILVANQNGKKLARIRADFAREQFSHNPAEDLDLKALENPGQPDNAPICPVMFAPGGAAKAYVTLRGGGMLVVDTASTPMKVLKSFTREQIAPAGCGGVVVGNKVYVNSGAATTGHLYVFDARTDDLVKTIETTRLGTDAHGMAVVGGGRYVWMVNRGEGDNVVVVDTTSDTIVGSFAGIGAGPDLMDVSPGGDRVFVTLRGPNNLTGGPTGKGETPGVAVIEVRDGGRTGARTSFAAIGPPGQRTDADPHALAVRFGSSRTAVQLPAALPRTGEVPLALVSLLGGVVGLAGVALAARRRAA